LAQPFPKVDLKVEATSKPKFQKKIETKFNN